MRIKFFAATVLATLVMTQTGLAQTLEGELDATNTKKMHKFKMEKGKVYQIDMTAAFDTYLRLNNAAGKEIAENDDYKPPKLDSRLVFSPSKTADFTIVADSFQSNGQGKYKITVKTYKLTGKAKVEKAKIDANSPLLFGKLPHQSYKMKLDAGKTYFFGASSENLVPVLAVRAVGGGQNFLGIAKASNDGKQAQVIFTPPNAGEYEVITGPATPTQEGVITVHTQSATAEEQKKDG